MTAVERANLRSVELQNQTFGCEVEMYGITREMASDVVARYFGTTNTYIGDGCYKVWGAETPDGRMYKFSRDASILAARDEEKCEMVTPILTYNDMNTLQEIIRLLRKNGAKSDPAHQCGVHIHVGANGHTAKSMRNLANIMVSHEDLIWEAIGIDSGRENWCRKANADFIREVNAKAPMTIDEFMNVWYSSQGNEPIIARLEHYNSTRYHMLNFHAYSMHKTIEFRMFQFFNPDENRKNGLHAGQLKAYIQLALGLSNLAKDLSSASPTKRESPNKKGTMNTFLYNLGFIGEEYETARMFYKRNFPEMRNRVTA